jgi:hypothetical protein
MVEGFREMLRSGNEYRVEADEYRELDGERVLVLFHARRRDRPTLTAGALR